MSVNMKSGTMNVVFVAMSQIIFQFYIMINISFITIILKDLLFLFLNIQIFQFCVKYINI